MKENENTGPVSHFAYAGEILKTKLTLRDGFDGLRKLEVFICSCHSFNTKKG